jgi:hypothetical protein
LQNVKGNLVSGIIKTVGVVIDQRHFSETKLYKRVNSNGILEGKYRGYCLPRGIKKAQTMYELFSSKHLKWNAEIDNPVKIL